MGTCKKTVFMLAILLSFAGLVKVAVSAIMGGADELCACCDYGEFRFDNEPDEGGQAGSDEAADGFAQ